MAEALQDRVGHSINHFGLQYLNQTDSDANAVFSPISFVTALYLVYLGTQKDSASAEEISRLLNFKQLLLGSASADIHEGLGKIYEDLEGDDFIFKKTGHSPPTKFESGNLVLSNKDFGELRDTFQATVKGRYSEVTLAQYSKNLDKKELANNLLVPGKDGKPIVLKVNRASDISDAVNEWVANKTSNNIKQIMPELRSMDELALAIVNAVYLNASWQHFDKKDTVDDFFYEAHGDKKSKVPFMVRKGKEFPYYNSEEHKDGLLGSIKFEALGLKYQGNTIALTILLPHDKDGLDELQRALTWSKLNDLYSEYETREVDVKLPKFKFDLSYDGAEMLKKMGVSKMFNAREAKLTEMFERPVPLGVSKIVHKATIGVDEKGIEASAVTTAILVPLSLKIPARPRERKKFIANRPFLFVVRHVGSGASLFMGRVTRL